MSSFSVLKLILFLVSVTIGSSTPSYRFDYKYSQGVSGWMKFHEVPATWDQARLLCHAEGAVLLSPIDKTFSKEMVKMMELQKNSCGIHTGIHALFAKGVFISLQGIPLSRIPVNWAPDEPDNFENNEDCLMMLPNGAIADVKCEEVFPFICYREKSKKEFLNPCGTIDDEYALDARTGHCYKFHAVGQTWSDAFMTCASEGGYLAIINNAAEAFILKDLFAKYPKTKLITSNFKDNVHIGFLDWNKNGEWYTIYGETLQEAGYNEWDSGQPNKLKRNGLLPYCGSIGRKATFNDMWCNETMGFICEKNSDSLLEEDDEDQNKNA